MHDNPNPEPRGASYDSSGPAVVIHDLTVNNPTVCSEAARWSTGQRGPAVGADALVDVDLSAFVTQAMAVGAQAIAAAGGVQDTYNLEQLVSDVGTRTAETSAKAAEATTAVVKSASDGMQKASTDAKNAIAEAGLLARKGFGETVESARKDLREEINRLVGGDNPELVARLSPLLDTFGRDMNERVAKQTGELLEKAARQFDTSDPTSPMAKHAKGLREQQDALSLTLVKSHEALAVKVDQLTTAVKVATAAADATSAIAKVTPIKGDTYAGSIHRVMQQIATGLGDEYTDTGAVTGVIPRCKKGDGLLTVNGGDAHVVLEMTDSVRPAWNDYLDEAERNREATASLGLVRELSQNAGQSIRVLSSRRIVMVFDPAQDDAGLLRTVVQLLRVGAIAANSRRDSEGLETAEERITEARAMLNKVNVIRTASGSIRKNADKIELECDSVQTGVDRLLSQALNALAGVALDVSDVGDITGVGEPDSESSSGVA
jgi:hypothetical protein